mmetsp:Transcript_37304/g.79228  ORF Transcript_37304/g.79228 Transcript_37304/m.79228 type:complete len:217 (-) Transcript_37304:1245-1895(-)
MRCTRNNERQLLRSVVGQVQPQREAPGKSGVLCQQVAHLVFVAGDDHKHLRAVILDLRQQSVHRLVSKAVLATAFWAAERVGLVNEQATTPGRAHSVDDFGRGVATILAFEFQRVHLNESILLQHPVCSQQAEEQACKSRLPRARVAGKHQVHASFQDVAIAARLDVIHTAAHFSDEILGHVEARHALQLLHHLGPCLLQVQSARLGDSEVLGQQH